MMRPPNVNCQKKKVSYIYIYVFLLSLHTFNYPCMLLFLPKKNAHPLSEPWMQSDAKIHGTPPQSNGGSAAKDMLMSGSAAKEKKSGSAADANIPD